MAMSLIQQLLAIAEPWIDLQEPDSSQGSANPLGSVFLLQHSNGETLPSHGKEARTQKTN
jgi:hypothetical protein